MLLVLWDIDGTLVDSAGHGRFAFEDAFREVVGRDPEWVDYAGRTDHQIALSMLNGSHEQLPDVLEGLATNLAARKDAISAEGHIYPGVREALAALHDADGVINSLLTGNLETNAAVKVRAFGLERWLDLEAAVAVATGFADLDALRASEPDALLQDLSDTEAAIRAITAST